MQTINLSLLIKELNLDQELIAKLLFPSNLHPKLALSRILKGETEMNESQLLSLSSHTGMSIDDLFVRSAWKMESKDYMLIFTFKDSVAKLDTRNFLLTIQVENNTVLEQVILKPQQTVKEFISFLNNKIQENNG